MPFALLEHRELRSQELIKDHDHYRAFAERLHIICITRIQTLLGSRFSRWSRQARLDASLPL
jgi:hypothetical protein